MSYLKDIKVGDKVFDYTLQKWGVVESILVDSEYPIIVVFSGSVARKYTYDGLYHKLHTVPILLWDEVKPIELPKRPILLPAKDTLVRVRDYADDEWLVRYSAGQARRGGLACWADGCTSKTTKDITVWKLWDVVDEQT